MSAPFVTSIVLAAAMLCEHREAMLVASFGDWEETHSTHCGPAEVEVTRPDEIELARMEADALLADWNDVARCGELAPDACLRGRLRARVEALEVGRSYDEVIANSPTGVAFVAPTRVR